MFKHLLIFTFLIISTSVGFAQTSITGEVTDSSGKPLPGVSIQVLNSTIGAVTNSQGSYELLHVPAGNQKIRASFIGFAAQTKEIDIDADSRKVNFRLSENVLELQELVVTAQKREEELQKVPIAVASIGEQRAEDLQISNLNEIGRISPNFMTYDDGVGIFSMVASRGIFTIDEKPTVGVYVDDVPLFSTYSFPAALTNIERIEVLRGPQGTLYGRNTLAGVINIVTKKPTNTAGGYIKAGYGSLNQFNVNAGTHLPLVDDKLFALIGGGFTTRDGYVENAAIPDSEDLLSHERINGNMKLSWLPSNKWNVTLSSGLEFRDMKGFALAGTPGATNAQLDSIKTNHPYEVNYSHVGNHKVLLSNNSLKVGYYGNKVSLTSITSFQRTKDTDEEEEYDFTPLNISYADVDSKKYTLSEELRLRPSQSNPAFDWLAGVFVYHFNEDLYQVYTSGPDNAMYYEDPETQAQFPYNSIEDNLTTDNGVSFFGNVDYNLTEKLSLIAGLRYEISKQESEVQNYYRKDGAPYTYPPLGVMPGEFEKSASYDALSPKFGLSYEANDQLLIYGNVAKGYRPGGINTWTSDEDKAVFDEEVSWNYEAGLKSTLLSNRLKLNLTGFYIDYQDQQLFTIIDMTTFNYGRENIGTSISYGLEMESEWILSKSLNALVNLGYLDTDVTEYTVINSLGETVDYSGNEQGYSPHWNGGLGLIFNKNLNDVHFNASLDYQFQTEMYFSAENNYSQDGYGILNGQISAQLENYKLSLWGKNLTDEVYFSYAYAISGYGGLGNYGLPATFGATLTAEF
ncbi:TonB-dependent receptor [Rhodohalobacter sp. 614A]|uniref:TonB-dependent receptor n=1 Tax=Rhodohalobacter sp. 614A TaxID=2908649 RepID=UPI001F245488|nr:TonB-dependent receptor [Rhodohalobacter sp. 614A]